MKKNLFIQWGVVLSLVLLPLSYADDDSPKPGENPFSEGNEKRELTDEEIELLIPFIETSKALLTEARAEAAHLSPEKAAQRYYETIKEVVVASCQSRARRELIMRIVLNQALSLTFGIPQPDGGEPSVGGVLYGMRNPTLMTQVLEESIDLALSYYQSDREAAQKKSLLQLPYADFAEEKLDKAYQWHLGVLEPEAEWMFLRVSLEQWMSTLLREEVLDKTVFSFELLKAERGLKETASFSFENLRKIRELFLSIHSSFSQKKADYKKQLIEEENRLERERREAGERAARELAQRQAEELRRQEAEKARIEEAKRKERERRKEARLAEERRAEEARLAEERRVEEERLREKEEALREKQRLADLAWEEALAERGGSRPPENCQDHFEDLGVGGDYEANVIFDLENKKVIPVVCDQKSDGGGWMLVSDFDAERNRPIISPYADELAPYIRKNLPHLEVRYEVKLAGKWYKRFTVHRGNLMGQDWQGHDIYASGCKLSWEKVYSTHSDWGLSAALTTTYYTDHQHLRQAGRPNNDWRFGIASACHNSFSADDGTSFSSAGFTNYEDFSCGGLKITPSSIYSEGCGYAHGFSVAPASGVSKVPYGAVLNQMQEIRVWVK